VLVAPMCLDMGAILVLVHTAWLRSMVSTKRGILPLVD
jgi:hypothetical protein